MSSTIDLLHEMLLIALDDNLHTAPPVADAATILDVGTGTGKWACDLAIRMPEARVYGIDLHQVSPDKMPTNVVFETVDVMTGFPFNTGTFEFVHSRLLVGGITDWDRYLANLLRITRRRGHVECIEMELRVCSGGGASAFDFLTETHSWTDRMASHLKQQGLDPEAASRLKQRMQVAGFVEIQERVIDIPISGWQAEQERIGEMARDYSRCHIVHWFEEVLIERGADRQEISGHVEAVMAELDRPESKAYLKWHFCVGRKGEA